MWLLFGNLSSSSQLKYKSTEGANVSNRYMYWKKMSIISMGHTWDMIEMKNN